MGARAGVGRAGGIGHGERRWGRMGEPEEKRRRARVPLPSRQYRASVPTGRAVADGGAQRVSAKGGPGACGGTGKKKMAVDLYYRAKTGAQSMRALRLAQGDHRKE